jgi:hypothetical protein
LGGIEDVVYDEEVIAWQLQTPGIAVPGEVGGYAVVVE